MDKNRIRLIFVISVLLVGAGAFYAGNYLAFGGSDEQANFEPDADILELAKQKVPEPALPPKPAGKEVPEMVSQVIEVPITRTEFDTINLGFGAKTKIPRVVVTTEKQTQLVKRSRFEEASAEENARWDKQVRELQKVHDAQLASEVKRLVRLRTAENAKQIAEMWKSIITDSILPLVVALTGLVGAIIALRKAFSTEPDKPA